jgi:hypothetical protein
LGAANGVATLDSGGKVPVSQLPSSVVTYLGTWNAATNTPTLVNGTGDAGDMYICNVAGTVNFGAGPVTFAVGDWVLYGSGTWQKSNGQNGTVTSVAVTESGDALTITGSPITTAGTINIGFAGTSGQYVNGAGNLTTFPSLAGFVTSVTATAPLLSSGGTTPDLSIPAASASVDGYLDNADWTTFNNKQNAITLTTTGTSGVSTLIGSTLNIPNYSTDLSGYVPYTGATANVNLGTFDLTADVITGATGSFASSGGSNTFAINHSSGSGIALNITKGGNGEGLYINKTSGSGNAATIIGTLNATTLVKSGGTSSQFLKADGSVDASAYITLASLSGGTGITYNNTTGVITNSAPDQTVSLTAGAGISISGSYPSFTIASTITQYTDALARAAISLTTTGTSGAATYNSTTGVFNIPNYAPDLSGYVPTSRTITINGTSFDLSANRSYSVGTVTSVGLSSATSGVTIGSSPITTSGTITLAIATASGSQNGLLSSTDWTTFNNKQSALTNPVTGTGTTNTLPKFTGASTIGNSNITDTGSLITLGSNSFVNGRFGIGSSPFSASVLFINANIQGSTTSFGVIQEGVIQSGVTSAAYGFVNALKTAAAVFTLSNYYHYNVGSSALGAGSSVTNQYGFVVESSVTTATNNFGFYGNIPAGTNRWNLYMNGTANNYMAGNLGIGVVPTGSTILQVKGASSGQVLSLQNTTASGYSGMYILNSAGAQTGHLGYANASAAAPLKDKVFFGSITNKDLVFTTNDLVRLTLAGATGAATFSSSVKSDGGASEGKFIIERDSVGTNTIVGSLDFTNNNAATTYGKVFGGRNSAGDGYVALGTGISNNLYALESGNVGIGTTSPSEKLDVIGGALAAGNGTIRTGITYSSLGLIGTFTNHDLGVITNGTERMRITSAGNVLVATTTDNGQGKLQVNGAITATNISYTGEIVTTSTTFNTTYYHIISGAVGSGQTYTLPSPSSNNLQYVIINKSNFSQTISAGSGFTIYNMAGSDVASITLASKARCYIIADGSGFYQIF